MDAIKRKLEEFTEASAQESLQNARQAIQKVKDEGETAVEAAQRQIEEETRAYVKKRVSEIKTREGSRVSARLLENKRKMFALRQQCAAEIGTEVQDKVQEFIASPEYGVHLKNLLKRAMEHMGKENTLTVLLRPEDVKHKSGLVAAAKGTNLSFGIGDFTMGGLVVLCPSKKLRVDLSFDTAIGDISEHFAELSGIDLE